MNSFRIVTRNHLQKKKNNNKTGLKYVLTVNYIHQPPFCVWMLKKKKLKMKMFTSTGIFEPPFLEEIVLRFLIDSSSIIDCTFHYFIIFVLIKKN